MDATIVFQLTRFFGTECSLLLLNYSINYGNEHCRGFCIIFKLNGRASLETVSAVYRGCAR